VSLEHISIFLCSPNEQTVVRVSLYKLEKQCSALQTSVVLFITISRNCCGKNISDQSPIMQQSASDIIISTMVEYGDEHSLSYARRTMVFQKVVLNDFKFHLDVIRLNDGIFDTD